MVSWKKIKNGAFAELYSHKKLRLVTIIILAFAGLMYGLGSDNGGVAAIGVLLYFAALFCLLIAAINVFSDMHDVQSADVQMSMPLNSSERYLSRLLTIFLIWILPAIISAAVAFLFNIIGGYSSEAEFYERLVTVLAYIRQVLIIIAVTIICQCCVGSKAESRYMPVLVMGIRELLPILISSFISDQFADVTIISLNLKSYYEHDTPGTILVFLLSYILYIAIIFAGIFIYKKRDARTVGKPIVFPLFFEIVMLASLMMFFTTAHFDGGVIASVMFVAWLGSIILRIIVSRKGFKLKSILIWTLQYAAYYAVFIIFMFAAFKTGGFGRLYRMPEKTELSEYTRVWVYVRDPDGSGDHYFDDRYDKLMETNEGDNAALINQLIESTSEYSKEQAKTKGLFMKKMFGAGDCNVKELEISVAFTDNPEDYSYDSKYNITFCVSEEKANDFINQLNSCGFEIIKDYTLEEDW